MVRVVDPEISICNPSPGVSTVTAPGDPAGNFEETESVGQSAEKATRTLPLEPSVVRATVHMTFGMFFGRRP